MNIATLLQTQLTQQELGQLFGVTRVTVNGWFRGRFKPHSIHKDKVIATAQALENAVHRGKLPLADDVPKQQRVPAARAAINTTV
jgi:transcriptional regulator with XRE-family HTH domain